MLCNLGGKHIGKSKLARHFSSTTIKSLNKKIKVMKKNYLLLFALMMCMQILFGQKSSTSKTTSSYNSKNYLGLRAGYVFKSKYANTNPMWHLKDGQFFELNAGKRINNSVFGFGAALGHLTLKRDVPKWETNSLNRQMIYDSLIGGTKPIITSGLNDNTIKYTKTDITEQYHKNFRGTYLLAGPEVWLVCGAFKVNAYLQAGISYNKVGYYYVEGSTKIADPNTVLLTGPFGAGTRNYTMNGTADFAQYGMSQKYYNKILASSATNNAAAFAIKEDGELGFMARAGISAEYFVTPKISLHGGASYWHIAVPKMEGAQIAAGQVSYVPNPGLGTSSAVFDYKDPYSTKNLGYASANVGIKYWMGRSVKSCTKSPKTAKAKKTKCCTTCPVYNLGVTARDKYTKEILPNTDVVIKNNAGEVVKTGKTNVFGVYIFEKIQADDYVISGALNNVSLENRSIKKDELICDQVIQKEILYTDRNFIVNGKAFECNSDVPLPGVSVILENTDLAYQKSTVTDAQGNFMMKLPEVGIYFLHAKKDNFLSQLEEVTSDNYNRDRNLFVKLEICAEKVECGKGINLRNILFDVDKTVIKTESKKELNKLIQFMKDNPAVKVELGSHTDSRSSSEYNQTLSESRAKASMDYVVSQGIAKDRITGIGYGESKLLNKCAEGVNCTEAEHALNRRTEMKMICP
jgi:outer membrane protein OmpA-like peptidoglycan-associated protein